MLPAMSACHDSKGIYAKENSAITFRNFYEQLNKTELSKVYHPSSTEAESTGIRSTRRIADFTTIHFL